MVIFKRVTHVHPIAIQRHHFPFPRSAPSDMKTRPTVKPMSNGQGPCDGWSEGFSSGKSSLATAEIRRPARIIPDCRKNKEIEIGVDCDSLNELR